MRAWPWFCATVSAAEAFPSLRCVVSILVTAQIGCNFFFFFTSQEQLEAKLDDFCDQNMKASSDYCMTLLQDIFGPLYEDVKQGTFSKPGGFRLFIRKRQELKNKYYQAPRKGIQVNHLLYHFWGLAEWEQPKCGWFTVPLPFTPLFREDIGKMGSRRDSHRTPRQFLLGSADGAPKGIVGFIQ